MASLKRKNGAQTWTAVVRVPKAAIEASPSSYRTRSGKTRTHLERATGTSDKRLAKKISSEFQVECDRLFTAQCGIRMMPESDYNAPLSTITNVKRFLNAQARHPEITKKLLLEHAMDVIRSMGLEEDTTFIEDKLELVSSGLTPEHTRRWLKAEAEASGQPINAASLLAIEQYTDELHDTRLAVSVIFNRYLKQRSSDDRVKKSTIQRSQRVFDEFCKSLPFSDRTKAADVTVKVVRDWVCKYQKQLTEQGRTIRTIRNHIDSISAVFAKAADDDLIASNPFRKYQNALTVSNRGIKNNLSNRSWINDDLPEDALASLLRAAIEKFDINSGSVSQKHMMPLIALALFTGARIEELCRLSADDIKQSHQHGIRYIDITEAKSQAGIREIPLSKQASTVVDWLLNQLNNDESRLFPGLIMRDGRFSHGPSNEFSRFKKALGYQRKSEYTFHSFRSTFITLLDRAGVTDEYISMIVGHSEGRRTLAKNTYSAGKKLEQVLGALQCVRYSVEIEHLLIGVD